MVRDLPVELWLEILSYLLPGHVRKLLGINRFLTEMALDEIYYTFTLHNGFRRIVSDILRTTQPMYAQRIRRLDILSCFLANSPEADDGLIIRDQSRLPPASRPRKRTLPAIGKWLGSLMISSRAARCSRLAGPTRQNDVPPTPRYVEPKVLAALRVALSHWLQLEEIGLFLHNYVSMPTFSDFLIDLWSQRGQNIRILYIDASLNGLFDFLEIFSTRLTPLPNLDYLSVKLLASQKYVGSGKQVEIGNKVAAFVECHKHSLSTLIISEPVFVKWVDTPTLIRVLGCLPKLKKIELPILMRRATISRLEYVRRFLELNEGSVECLKMEYRTSALYIPAPRDAYESLLGNVLPRLRFGVLVELEMDVGVGGAMRVNVPFRLPPLGGFAPRLERLVLKGSHGYLTEAEIVDLVDNLSGGARMLRSLCFRLEVLSVEMLDLIALNLPMLESLSITYIDVLVDGDDGSFESPRIAFCETFNRHYANWALKYLRLAKASVCEKGHPDCKVSESVAKAIPGLEVVDNERECNCILYNEVLFLAEF